MSKHPWLRRLAEPKFEWQLLQTFLDVAELGSFRRTSLERLVALNTVRGRISELERITGRKLLERGQNGAVNANAPSIKRSPLAGGHAASS